MATSNPFSDDPDKGEVFEQGYFAGFADPGIVEFLPLTPELLSAYRSGIEAGREDRLAPADSDKGSEWAELATVAAEHGLVHALGIAVENVFKEVSGGLISLVLTVVTIPGDVMIQPLEPEAEMPSDQPGDTYVAVCTRTDHPMLQVGATPDGYWMGPPRGEWVEAANDRAGHGHAESFVARCSVPEATCGPVWAIK